MFMVYGRNRNAYNSNAHEVIVHSFSLFTFFSPSAAAAVPTLLAASDCAASATAAFTRVGAFPDTGPASSPTVESRVSVSSLVVSQLSCSYLGCRTQQW